MIFDFSICTSQYKTLLKRIYKIAAFRTVLGTSNGSSERKHFSILFSTSNFDTELHKKS